MKARGLAALTPKAALTPFEFERRELGPHDVVLDIAYAGICHSDIHQVREEWGPAIFPMVPGHEIAGSMIGGIPEMQEMLDFCGKHSIVSDIEVIDASYADKAYERTIASDVKYRFVIDASTF